MALDEKKKGEIAYAMLKIVLEEKGLRLSPEAVKREIGNTSKKIGVDPKELKEFLRMISQEIMDECFA